MMKIVGVVCVLFAEFEVFNGRLDTATYLLVMGLYLIEQSKL